MSNQDQFNDPNIVVNEPATGTLEPEQMPQDRIITFGERAVGLSFNPSQNPEVYHAKRLSAEIIDMMDQLRQRTSDPEVKRMCSVAITEAQTAQMWAVKAITWK